MTDNTDKLGSDGMDALEKKFATSSELQSHHIYMAFSVVGARKKYQVKYPALYADENNCKNEEHRSKFNCIQRGHQNSLENQPIFLALLAAAGIFHPLTAGAAGFSYLLGRILYFVGYATGRPDGRYIGALPTYAGLLTLLGITIKVSVDLLRSF